MENFIRQIIVMAVVIGIYMLGYARPEPLEGAIIAGLMVGFVNIALNIYIVKSKACKKKSKAI